MNIHTLIKELHRHNVGLSVDADGKLCVSAETGDLSEPLRAALSSNEKTLLSWLSDRSDDTPVVRPLLGRAPPAAAAPLSFGQEGLWLFERAHADLVAYHGATASVLRQPLDAARFVRAVEQVIARHQVLRTGIELQGGQPVQVVHETTPAAATFIDLTEAHARDGVATERKVREEMAAETLRKFDLRSPPFLRVRLYRLQRNHHVLFFCLHHLVYDAQSLRILMEEIRSFYDGGAGARLPELPLQYRDFAVWQRSTLSGERLQSLTDFWRQTLSGCEMARLPHDHAPPARGMGSAAHHALTLDNAEIEPLEARARECGVTAFMLYLAAFYVVLYKHTGRTDLAVGTDVAGRANSQLDRLIGFFANQLVLRHRLDPSVTFRQLLGQVKALTSDAFEHQDMPFSRLVESLGAGRDAIGNPFFCTKFIFEHDSEHAVPAWATERIELPGGDAKFEMVWALRRHAHGVDLTVEYDSALFAGPGVSNLVEHYRRVLAEVLAHPDKPISLIDLADAADKALYESRNNCKNASTPVQSIASMLEASARRNPRHIAVVEGSGSITYGDLNARSNRLARLLLSRGLQVEARVGVCMASGIDYLTSVSALSKMGAVLVPIDSSLPERRISQIIADARLDMILTRQEWLDALPAYELNFLQVLCLDEETEALESLDDADLPQALHAERLAYLVFTSGSTGKPKGVMLAHAGLASLVTAQMEGLAVESTSRILQFASIGFDASIFEIVMTLEAGATLYCDQRPRLMPGTPLLEFLEENAITHVTLPPSALEVMNPRPLPALRTIVLAGEACKDEVVRRWQAQARIVNAYGPSETTVCATMTAPVARDGFQGSIGVPIRGSDVYIITPDGALAPVGVPGELCIGGVGVGRGYWQDPLRTAHRYVPDAFSGRPGARLYRTGDLARYRRDGEIQFLGRIDRQVKLRGFRIEPAEIENALVAHPQVRQAAVLVHENPRELWACVVTADGQLDEASVRSHLRESLPEYMVPARILPIETIPVTINGKVDLARIEQIALAAASPEDCEQPMSASEARVHAIWRAVLDRGDFSKRQNFFDAGGNSLLLMQVHERLQAELGIELQLEELFRYPTIESLAAFVQSGAQAPDIFAGVNERLARRNTARADV